MDLQLGGKRALVVGGSRGIGRAIALTLAEEGCRVSVCARGEDGLSQIAGELAEVGAAAVHHQVVADVTAPDGARAAVEAAAEALGGIDVLVNNVGKSGARCWDEVDEADLERGLDLNLRGSVRACLAAVPIMRRAGGGSIIMISSIWGREAGGAPVYNVAKAGVISLAKAMARDLARDRIRVNSVAPGSILFPGGGWDRKQQADPEGIAAFVEREIPAGRFGSPEEIAAVVAFLASPRASWVSGVCLPVDGCQSRAF